MTVTTSKLAGCLARVQQAVRDPRVGLYGPGSATWQVARESGVFVAAGRAALLQLAHPFVAHAVEQHSATRTDPAGRFLRTFENVYPMIFGDLDSALRCARRVHGVHRSVSGFVSEQVGDLQRGDPYHANHEPALLWVAATLWDSSILAYELLHGPLGDAFKERYYQECKLFAYLFGISDDVLPPTWSAFQRYVQSMVHSDELVVGDVARSLGCFLLSPPRPLGAPAVHAYAAVTARLLPEPVRRAYGLPLGRVEQALAASSIAALRGLYPALPSRVRFIPAYRDALRRIEGRPRGRLGEALEQRLRAAAQAGFRVATQRA